MAIRIFESAKLGAYGGAPIRQVPFLVRQADGTVGASSTQSAAFGATTNIVTIQTDETAYVVFGPNPTATTGTGYRIAAGTTEDFGVQPGDKVAWIAGS